MSGSQGNTHQYNILIIDNNELDLLLLDVAVQQIMPAAKISTFFSSLEALDLLSKKELFSGEELHMLMVSSKIERLDLVSTLNLFMKNPCMQAVPVVIFSNESKSGDDYELPRQGKYAFYKMPGEMDALLKLVEEIREKFLG